MGKILTSDAVIMCPHGGQVTISVQQTKASAGGKIARSSDTFTVAGCAFVLAMSPHPCVTVEWQMASTKVKAGDAVLTTDSIGLCKAGDQATQGTALIQSTQMKASAL